MGHMNFKMFSHLPFLNHSTVKMVKLGHGMEKLRHFL